MFGNMKKIILLFCALVFVGCYENSISIPVTNEEIQFIDSFFGGTIHSNRVDLFENEELQRYSYVAQADRNNIHFRADLNYSENREFYRPLLIHELVHVWQWQHGFLFFALDNDLNNDYSYLLDIDQKFKDYGIEQQAELIQDYYILIELNNNVPLTCINCAELTDEEILNDLERLYNEMLEE